MIHLPTYAQYAFDNAQNLTMIEAWYASTSYVLSYYFDLSGYADMAIGIAKMFNIDIPKNFNSPYKARNFADYWRRWHMTLSRFLGDYIYKSLGGNKNIVWIIYLNIMITFFVSGFWHGAGSDLCCLGASKWSFCCNGTYDEKSKFTNELLFSLVFNVYWAYHYKNTLCCKRF